MRRFVLPSFTPALFLLLSLSRLASQSTESVLYTFRGLADGGNPYSSLIPDSAGNMYGITYGGGVNGWGVVFKLAPMSDGSWKESVIHQFSFADGAQPMALTRDSAGNLFGVTFWGGQTTCFSEGCGTVFELSPTSDSWRFRVIHFFTGGYDGYWPIAISVSSSGEVYANAQQGGNYLGPCASSEGVSGCGTIYELSTVGHTWRGRTIHAFTLNDGAAPYGNLVFDAAGNIYGTTYTTGSTGMIGSGCGIVFRLAKSNSGAWGAETLYTFTGGDDGLAPLGGVTLDGAGNVYGTTEFGGSAGGGVAFRLTASSQLPWQQTILHPFSANGGDGFYPGAAMTFDSAGNLYGTTGFGGYPCTNLGCGVVFELSPSSTGWSESILYAFTGGSNGLEPLISGVTLGQNGTLFGTTTQGGPYEDPTCPYGTCGIVYELAPPASHTH